MLAPSSETPSFVISQTSVVTADESARIFSSAGGFGRTRVAPRTTYGVARVQQEWGPPGSTVAFTATGMHRELAPGEPLANLMARNAFTLSADSLFRLKDGEYELQLYTGMTRVDGEAGALDRVQRHSARYLQRPDADYVQYDPLRTSMAGGKSGFLIERLSGRHWLWQAEGLFESPEYETTNLGRLNTGDGLKTLDAVAPSCQPTMTITPSYAAFDAAYNAINTGGSA